MPPTQCQGVSVPLLQSDKNSNDIHEEYEQIAKEMQFRSLNVKIFQRTWTVFIHNTG